MPCWKPPTPASRLRGKTDEALVVEGKDGFYARGAVRRLYVPLTKTHPLNDAWRACDRILQFAQAYTDWARHRHGGQHAQLYRHPGQRRGHHLNALP